MLEILKNIFFFKAVKTKKYYKTFSISFKPKKERLLLLIPENTGDKRSVCVKLKYQLNIEKKV